MGLGGTTHQLLLANAIDTVVNSIKKIYFTHFSRNKDFYTNLYRLLGFFPTNVALYKQAFVHNSTAKMLDGLDSRNNNERLEYLGDAVLDLIIAEFLFKKFPFQNEGFLTDMRSKSVSRKMLANIAFKMGLQEHIIFDKNISKNHTAVRGIAGNALEALVGAIYLDKGFTFAKKFVKRKIVTPHLDFDELKDITVNFKSLLNQYAQKEKKNLDFKILNPEEEHKIKIFIIGVLLEGIEIAAARASSKKVAEQMASEKACDILGLKTKQVN